MAYLENRVKNSLACFSDFGSKRTELVKSNSGISPSKLKSMQKLQERIRTFSLTWFAKPDWLSPVNCARLGWRNIDVDILECDKCKAIISAKLPSSQNNQVYDECCKRLESMLQNGHRICCSRKSRPVSSDVCQLTLRNRSNELEDFISRVKRLIELKSHLPIIEESAFVSLKLTMDDVVPLCRLAINVCPSVADVDQSVLLSACLLALCGWNVSSSTSCGELVDCTFCDRKIGLWNYFSHNQEFDVESTTTMSGYYASSDLAANNLDTCAETDFGDAACELTDVAPDTDLQPINDDPKVLHGEGTNGEVTGIEKEENCSLADERNLDSFSGEVSEEQEMKEDVQHETQKIVNEKQEMKKEIQKIVSEDQEIKEETQKIVSEDQEMKEDVQHELQTTDVSHEALVTCSPFSRSQKHNILNEDETKSLQFLATVVPGSNVVLINADTHRDAETCHVAEEETAVRTTCDEGDGSVKQETVAMNDAGLGPSNGEVKCQNDEVLGGVEIGGEEHVIDSVERGEESASVELVSSLEGFSDIPDLSGDCVGTCDTISSYSFGGSTVNSTQQDASGAEVGVCGDVGGGGVIDDFIEDSCNRSGETVVDGEKQGECIEAVKATESETLPSLGDDTTLVSDGVITDTIYTVGVSDEHSGMSVEVQMDIGDPFQCVATAEDVVSGLDYAADGLLEERSENVRDKQIESNDGATTSCSGVGDLCEANSSKPVINSDSSKIDVHDIPTYKLTDQPTAQPAVQPTVQPAVQPTAQPADQSTAQSADQPTAQSADQSTAQPADQSTAQSADQPTAQLIDVLTDQSDDPPTSRLTDELTDQPTAQPVDQPTAQLSDELKDQPTSQPTDHPTAQPVVQPDQPTVQLTDEAADQLTEQQLTDLETAANVVELVADNERDVEPHIQGSMKRTAAALEESKSSAKRRRLDRPVRGHFDPVAEHRPWCIWVQDLVTGRCPWIPGGNEDGLRDAGSRPAPQHPWIRLFHLLLQPFISPDRRDVRRALSLFKSF